MYDYGDHEINYQRRFSPWDTSFFSLCYLKITLFENKYDIKLITLISMYHLKHLTSLGRFIKKQNADVQIVLCIDTVQILCIAILSLIKTFYRRFMYFEDTVTYFDKIFMFPRGDANWYIEIYPVIVVLKWGLKVVRNKKSKFFSHRCLIEFYETNRMSHVPLLYDVVNLLK